MNKINLDQYEDEEYEVGGFVKMRSKGTKKKFKGHQSKHNRADKYDYYEEEEILPTYQPPTPPVIDRVPTIGNTKLQENLIRREAEKAVERPQTVNTGTNPHVHEFGPNTHEIKGVKIDFDGVSDIQMVDNEKDGHMTYGIKFVFKGKKGFSRIVWFNMNQRMRDKSYADEYTYWISLRTLINEKDSI